MAAINMITLRCGVMGFHVDIAAVIELLMMYWALFKQLESLHL